MARHLGAKDPSPSCTLPIKQELATIKGRLAGIKLADRRLAVLNPAARWKTKLWPEPHFAELADRLSEERNMAVIFTGSLDDRRMNERICALMKRGGAVNWAGETTLKELAALASLSDVFITTDTGSMHVAAAAGAKVVALFGPTAPWRTGPYGPSGRVIRAEIDCSPCFQRSCDKSIKCMAGITVAQVMKELPM